MGTFRKLYANEIECRVANVKQPSQGKAGGVSVLLYKDARVDMRMLDEVYGAMNWKREHQSIDGRLYCTISVYNEKTGEWVSKQDVGVESYTEKEKGQASDSFKRAGFNWGIGRELYTAPFIWITLADQEWSHAQNGVKPKVNFDVADIAYNGENISYLVIKDDKGKIRFTHGKKEADKDLKAHALWEVGTCNSIEEIQAVWNKYAILKTDEDFKAAVTEKGNELKNK